MSRAAAAAAAHSHWWPAGQPRITAVMPRAGACQGGRLRVWMEWGINKLSLKEKKKYLLC